ncbi:uncharacterized protein EDB93DRAFT_1246619 [Suillus bovinus]|uniref:uncharacterized protein n=1 Tax=Suillus bovinus TaxID=48563 RepID=UPI001B879629|nr:uncharacterized protein EDB93DRAFT_1246619 [Suillus bovinus]KAG2158133.1 hypothetical protein EDB93DRAFT_1246619 [Suillus bovinus]
MPSDTAENSATSPILKNFPPITNPILKVLFEVLCVVAVSRTSIDHWAHTCGDEWKEHVKVMINRCEHSNVTAGLILATTALLLTSQSPLSSLMAYDISASYVFAVISFSAALLSVISGAALVVIYETSTVHKDMECLKDMTREHVIYLLLWLAYPSVCLSVSAFFLFVSLFIACFSSRNIFIQVIMALSGLAFTLNGILTIHVFCFVPMGKSLTNPKPANDPARVEQA